MGLFLINAFASKKDRRDVEKLVRVEFVAKMTTKGVFRAVNCKIIEK